MGALEYSEHYTKADYALWEGEWELIAGTAYAMAPSPSVTHQSVATKIAAELQTKSAHCDACMVLSETDYAIADDTVVRPDILLICKPIEEAVNKTPEIIFEVLSAATTRRDETVKFDLYEREGVRYYVIVHPQNRVAKLYRRYEDGRFVKQGDFTKEAFRFEIDACTFDFDFSKIWRHAR